MYLYPFQKADYFAGLDPGPGQGGPSGPPCPALIHQSSNSGIELPSTGVKSDAEARVAVAKMIQQLPGRLRKKMYAIRKRIEWMVQEYGIEHVGLQTLTIRENVTDRKEFTRRFKSLATNVFPKNLRGLAAGLRAAATRGLARSCRGGHERGHPHGLQRGRPEPIVQRQQGAQDHQGRLLRRNPPPGLSESAGHLEGVPAVVRRAGVQSTAQIQGQAVLQV